MTATIKYQIATYSGTVEVSCDPDDENETLFAKARRELIRQSGGASLPYGSENFWVLGREESL